MRRGLISWSKTELPVATLDARIASAQAAMAKAGIDALAVYSNPSLTAGVAWFTNFLPYWNQSLLVLPQSGQYVLVTGLSNRVNDWMKRNVASRHGHSLSETRQRGRPHHRSERCARRGRRDSRS